jgi:hypothetical protein
MAERVSGVPTKKRRPWNHAPRAGSGRRRSATTGHSVARFHGRSVTRSALERRTERGRLRSGRMPRTDVTRSSMGEAPLVPRADDQHRRRMFEVPLGVPSAVVPSQRDLLGRPTITLPIVLGAGGIRASRPHPACARQRSLSSRLPGLHGTQCQYRSNDAPRARRRAALSTPAAHRVACRRRNAFTRRTGNAISPSLHSLAPEPLRPRGVSPVGGLPKSPQAGVARWTAIIIIFDLWRHRQALAPRRSSYPVVP